MSDIGKKFNYNNVFYRDLTLCVLDTLESEIFWTNTGSDGCDTEVNVPFYYANNVNSRFILDAFVDDTVSDSRKTEFNTDIIPRGILTLNSISIEPDYFTNPNVWLKMVLENNDEIKKILTKIKAIPVSVKYSLSILLNSEIDILKCSQSILDTLCFYRYVNFEYNYMRIDANIQLPNENTINMNKEAINLTSDNQITLNCDFEVKTYYPSFRKPRHSENNKNINDTWSNAYYYDDKILKNESPIENPKRSKWYLNMLKLQGR